MELMTMVQDIEMEFEAQLRMISDPSIKEKVVETWCKACRTGGLKSIQELKELPFTVVADARGISLLQHAKAAADGAVALARIQMEMPSFPRVDMDILVAGALLHDINKVLILERSDKGVFRKKIGQPEDAYLFPAIRIAHETLLPDSIVRLIEYECGATQEPNSVEAVLVHHADWVTFDTMNFLDNDRKARL
jgi:HD domain